MNETGALYMQRGQDGMTSAHLQVALGEAQEAERLARGALADFRGAMNWLEDTPDFDVAHILLDEAGRWIRETFGCWLQRESTTYSRTCPADLAHIRIGFSPGMTNVVRECTVCGQDPRHCRHIKGRTYPAVCRIVGGDCNLCGAEVCDHQDGEPGDVVCTHWIVSCEVIEISLVPRPAQPMARIHKESMSLKELADSLGPGWVPGMDVSCDRCLRVCLGVHEVDPVRLARAIRASEQAD